MCRVPTANLLLMSEIYSLNLWTDGLKLAVKFGINLLLNEQSDQGLHHLLFQHYSFYNHKQVHVGKQTISNFTLSIVRS